MKTINSKIMETVLDKEISDYTLGRALYIEKREYYVKVSDWGNIAEFTKMIEELTLKIEAVEKTRSALQLYFLEELKDNLIVDKFYIEQELYSGWERLKTFEYDTREDAQFAIDCGQTGTIRGNLRVVDFAGHW